MPARQRKPKVRTRGELMRLYRHNSPLSKALKDFEIDERLRRALRNARLKPIPSVALPPLI